MEESIHCLRFCSSRRHGSCRENRATPHRIGCMEQHQRVCLGKASSLAHPKTRLGVELSNQIKNVSAWPGHGYFLHVIVIRETTPNYFSLLLHFLWPIYCPITSNLLRKSKIQKQRSKVKNISHFQSRVKVSLWSTFFLWVSFQSH